MAQWHNTKEKMPPIDSPFLAFFVRTIHKNGELKMRKTRMQVYKYKTEGDLRDLKYHIGDVASCDSLTHWMELPPEPEEQK